MPTWIDTCQELDPKWLYFPAWLLQKGWPKMESSSRTLSAKTSCSTSHHLFHLAGDDMGNFYRKCHSLLHLQMSVLLIFCIVSSSCSIYLTFAWESPHSEFTVTFLMKITIFPLQATVRNILPWLICLHRFSWAISSDLFHFTQALFLRVGGWGRGE